MVRERVRQWAPCAPLLVIAVPGTGFARGYQDAARDPDVLAFLLVAVAVLAIAARARPAWLMVLNGAAVAAFLAAGYPFGPILLTVPVAYFLLAARRPVGRAAMWAGGHFGLLMAATVVKMAQEPAGLDWGRLAWTGLVWGAIGVAALAVAAAIRVRGESTAGVRAEQARRAASEERLRMAQDLHDNIGHGLAVIAMQAGVALHVLDRSPEQAREAMEAVRATSRESLENLRAQLEALRSPGAAAERHPAPGLEDVERLAERVRSGGVDVGVDIDPDLPELPAEVDAAMYRILQESLTNVLRHAGAAEARIRVRRRDGTLLLDVVDSGQARPGLPGSGSGIRGMRAQAEALGGTLRAGPRPAGGFEVAVSLPLREDT